MRVNPDNPSGLSFTEITGLLKDKNASRFFPGLTAKGSSERRETISFLQQAHVLNANKGSRAGQSLAREGAGTARIPGRRAREPLSCSTGE